MEEKTFWIVVGCLFVLSIIGACLMSGDDTGPN